MSIKVSPSGGEDAIGVTHPVPRLHGAYEALLASQIGKSERIAYDISWSDVNFAVDNKSILHACWGQVPASKTCAIMGASGAGKSSLLNVLAGRSLSVGSTVISGKVRKSVMILYH